MAQETPRNELLLQAPAGQFRVVGIDTFDGTDWIEGDFDTHAEALTRLHEKTVDQVMLRMYVYDDEGRVVGQGGSF